jgi:hypothetical protein
MNLRQSKLQPAMNNYQLYIEIGQYILPPRSGLRLRGVVKFPCHTQAALDATDATKLGGYLDFLNVLFNYDRVIVERPYFSIDPLSIK